MHQAFRHKFRGGSKYLNRRSRLISLSCIVMHVYARKNLQKLIPLVWIFRHVGSSPFSVTEAASPLQTPKMSELTLTKNAPKRNDFLKVFSCMHAHDDAWEWHEPRSPIEVFEVPRNLCLQAWCIYFLTRNECMVFWNLCLKAWCIYFLTQKECMVFDK